MVTERKRTTLSRCKECLYGHTDVRAGGQKKGDETLTYFMYPASNSDWRQSFVSLSGRITSRAQGVLSHRGKMNPRPAANRATTPAVKRKKPANQLQCQLQAEYKH